MRKDHLEHFLRAVIVVVSTPQLHIVVPFKGALSLTVPIIYYTTRRKKVTQDKWVIFVTGRSQTARLGVTASSNHWGRPCCVECDNDTGFLLVPLPQRNFRPADFLLPIKFYFTALGIVFLILSKEFSWIVVRFLKVIGVFYWWYMYRGLSILKYEPTIFRPNQTEKSKLMFLRSSIGLLKYQSSC